MNIVIVHYHLNRGGVTQVIANHLRGLHQARVGDARLRVALLFGGRAEGWPTDLAAGLERLQVSLHPIPELDYDNERPHAGALADQLQTELRKADLTPETTVLHVHNHCLGKNVAMPEALAGMARAGYPLLLQIHDFAEDFRPETYAASGVSRRPGMGDELTAAFYPQAPHVHYALLNQRDCSILREADVDPSRLHFLPNAVASIGPLPERDAARAKLAGSVPPEHRFLLYPARGIRRKNLGEAVLWSALAERATVGLTLPPLNPIEQRSYEAWKTLAAEHGLPCRFEVGAKAGLKYAENLAAADAILSTSVAEGFGLVFLESWLFGRPLVGRDLPEITADFVAAGLRFPGLHSRLSVPLDWLDKDAFRVEITAAYREALSEYGVPAPPAATLRRAVDAITSDDLVDFAQCPVPRQREIVQRVARDASSRDEVRSLNAWIASALEELASQGPLIERNAELVRTHYSLERSGRQLLEIYRQVAASDRGGVLRPPPRGERILGRFLELSRFHPLRVAS